MFTVRQAELRDAEEAVAVLRRSITELCMADHQGDEETIAKWLANKTQDRFRSWLANPENFCVVAAVEGQVLGVGLIHRCGEIRLCYLAPGLQRQGMGKAIYLALEERAKVWGLSTLRLQSTASACPFYESVDYQTKGTPQPGFGVSHCYPYEKTLKPDKVLENTGTDAPDSQH